MEKHQHSRDHSERKRQREEEYKRMIEMEKTRKKRRAAARHHRHSIPLITRLLNILNIITFNLFVTTKEPSNNEELLRKKLVEKKIRKKRRDARKEKIKEFFKHPFGKPLTELQKIELEKEKLLKKKIKSKSRKLRLLNFKRNINQLFSAFRESDIRLKLFQLIPFSLSSFLFAYITIYLITQIATCLISSFWSINTVLSTSVIYYEPTPYSPLWTKGSVVSIFSMQPFFAFVISLFGIYLFIKNIHKSSFLKTFLIWLIVIGQSMAWGSVFGAFIRNQGLFHAIQWGFYNTWFSFKMVMVVMLIVAFFWLIIFGYIIKPLFINSSPSASLLKGQNRFAFYQFQFSIPSLLGIFAIIAINAPIYNIYLLIQIASLTIILLPLLFDNTNSNENFGQIKINRSKTNIYIIIGILALTILVFKLIFDDGIAFG